MQQETGETTAGMSQMQTRLWERVLAVILVAYGLLMSFLLLRWSGGTSATALAKSLRIKKSTKR
jgi:succinate dehydrogenase hydrophobic anchor subunit